MIIHIEIDDELLEYVYSLKKQTPFTTFYDIDPYIPVSKELGAQMRSR